jgi:hypothetical protein
MNVRDAAPKQLISSARGTPHCDRAWFLFQILGLLLAVVHGYDSYLAYRQFRGYG